MLCMSELPLFSFNVMVLLVLPKFLCCLPPLNTTMGQISHIFLCVPGYLHLPFSFSKNYLRKSFCVMRRSKLFVLLTFEDSRTVVWLPLQCFETEEGSRKSHKKLQLQVEGGLYPLHIWSGKRSLAWGLGSLARCILYILSLSCRTFWIYEVAK